MTVARRRAGLFLGIDPYVLRACARADLDAIVVVGAGARDFGLHAVPEWATAVPVDDQASVESVLTALARQPGLADTISFIQTTDERALVCAAAIGAALGLDGLDAGTAVRFRDKSVQKALVRAAGCSTARTIVVDDLRTLDPTQVDLFPRSVLKPVAGAGTSLTSVIDDHDDLAKAVRDARTTAGGPRTFILEEFVSGRELTADGVVVDGELAFAGLGAYAQPCLATIIAHERMQTYKLDPLTDRAIYDEVLPTVVGALNALGLRNGVFHMELFHDEATGTVFFSECAARRGGGLIHEEIERKFSVDLGDAALRLAAGLDLQITPKLRPGVVGATFLPPREGILLDCPTAAELLQRPSVEYARIELPIGFRMGGSVNDTISRVGQVLLRAPTLQAFHAVSDDTVAWFDQRMSVLPTSLTPAELRERELAAQATNLQVAA